MGKKWDATGIAFNPALWSEALRVLLPGGHLLAFGGTRTYHRMTTAIENAGFEVRDCLMWVYGSGFPKSLDVSKAIDKQNGIWRGRAGEIISGNGSMSGGNYARNPKGEPATDDAKRWQGWGTALKPAWEPVVMARKPLEGTVAANVLAYGTGALNIDGCRVACDWLAERGETWLKSGNQAKPNGWQGPSMATGSVADRVSNLGRWPANVIHDGSEVVVNLFPSAPGQIATTRADGAEMGNAIYGAMKHGTEAKAPRADASDNAARFFNALPLDTDDYPPLIYAAKASRSEREAGCGDLEKKPGGSNAKGFTADVARGLDHNRPVRNHHPTVKPVSVMRHLVRLVTRKGGVVLDPFMGSGSTGIAAVKEGMRFVGIERESEYFAIAHARIQHAREGGFAKTEPPDWRLSVVKETATKTAAKHKEATVFVQSIESNVKKGAKAELGPRTLIVGPNGSGKSSIVNAVEIALSGRASDVVGRVEIARGIDLLTLAPLGATALWSKAILSDGTTAEWRCERNNKTGGAREPSHTLPPNVVVSFPVRAVRAALEGKPETVRAWLLGYIGSSVSDKAVDALIPDDLLAVYAEVTRPLIGTPVQVLLDARDEVGRLVRSLSSDAKAAERLAEQVGAGLGVEPSESEIEAARVRVREAAAAAVSPPVGDPEAAKAAAMRAVENYAARQAEVEGLRAIVGETSEINEDVARLRDALTRVLTFTATNHLESCLICGGAAGHSHASMLTRADGLTQAARRDVVALDARNKLGSAETMLAAAKAEAERAVATYQRVAAASIGASAGDNGAALREAEGALRALESARAAWENVRAAKARARDATARQRAYSDLKDVIEDAIKTLLERSRQTFIGRVQSFLPEADVFDLRLEEDGKDVCKFGFVRDGALHTALSGAEWARLTLALAAAVTEDDGLSILTPEDRAFDGDTLRGVMAALSSAPGQVILCSPVPPTGRTPKGWTVIDLTVPKSKGKAQKASDADTLDE